MSYQQTPQRLIADSTGLPLTPELALDQIQGDVLIGLQKNVEHFVFFEITDLPNFKTDLRWTVADLVTTTQTVKEREFLLAEMKDAGDTAILPLIGINVGFTNAGINKLVAGLPAPLLGDASFDAGAKNQAKTLNDPVDAANVPTTWVADFLNAYPHIDGVFLITGGTQADVDDAEQQLLDALTGHIAVVYEDSGKARPGLARGHEHFGWLDGVSQPGIKGLTDPFPGQRLLDSGHFVFGDPTTPALPQSPSPPATQPAWMENGSFLVFRRLQQLVPEFEQYLLHPQFVEPGLSVDSELLGARLVGRWKSGAPVDLTPIQDDTALGANPQGNNNFDFATDPGERRCPFGAHIRKVNPRADFADQKNAVDPRRIIRAGIPYGPEVSADEEASQTTASDRGLMFLCYQTSIPNQFEFLQISWVNNKDFISPIAVAKTHPDGSPVQVGFDPLIGQNDITSRSRFMDEPIPNYPMGNVRSTLTEPTDFVIPTASAYFFVPSLNALKTVLSD